MSDIYCDTCKRDLDECLRDPGAPCNAYHQQHLFNEKKKLEAQITKLNAEVEMLRGVGCMEDGDGPCGVCVKCALEGWHTKQMNTNIDLPSEHPRTGLLIKSSIAFLNHSEGGKTNTAVPFMRWRRDTVEFRTRYGIEGPKPELPIITKPCEICDTPTTNHDDPDFKGQWLCYCCHCHQAGRNVKEALNALATIMKGVYTDTEITYPDKRGFFYICVSCARPIQDRGMCRGCSRAYGMGKEAALAGDKKAGGSC